MGVSTGQRLAGREMEIGEDHLPISHQGPFLLQRLLHLHDQIRLRPNGFRIRHNARAMPAVIFIRNPAALPRASLDQDLVPTPGQFLHPHRDHPHPRLMGLDFAGHPHGDGTIRLGGLHGARPGKKLISACKTF